MSDDLEKNVRKPIVNNIFHKKNIEYSLSSQNDLPYKSRSDFTLNENQIVFTALNNLLNRLVENDIYNNELVKNALSSTTDKAPKLITDKTAIKNSTFLDNRKVIINDMSDPDSDLSIVYKTEADIEHSIIGNSVGIPDHRLKGKHVYFIFAFNELYFAGTDDGLWQSQVRYGKEWTRCGAKATDPGWGEGFKGQNVTAYALNSNIGFEPETKIINKYQFLIAVDNCIYGYYPVKAWCGKREDPPTFKKVLELEAGTVINKIYVNTDDSSTYIATSKGLIITDGDKRSDVYFANGTFRKEVLDVVYLDDVEDPFGRIMIATDEGVFQSTAKSSFKNLKIDKRFSTNITSFLKIGNDLRYIATENGVYKVSGALTQKLPADRKDKNYVNPLNNVKVNKLAYCNGSVLAVSEDVPGVFLIASNNYVNKLDSTVAEITTTKFNDIRSFQYDGVDVLFLRSKDTSYFAVYDLGYIYGANKVELTYAGTKVNDIWVEKENIYLSTTKGLYITYITELSKLFQKSLRPNIALSSDERFSNVYEFGEDVPRITIAVKGSEKTKIFKDNTLVYQLTCSQITGLDNLTANTTINDVFYSDDISQNGYFNGYYFSTTSGLFTLREHVIENKNFVTRFHALESYKNRKTIEAEGEESSPTIVYELDPSINGKNIVGYCQFVKEGKKFEVVALKESDNKVKIYFKSIDDGDEEFQYSSFSFDTNSFLKMYTNPSKDSCYICYTYADTNDSNKIKYALVQAEIIKGRFGVDSQPTEAPNPQYLAVIPKQFTYNKEDLSVDAAFLQGKGYSNVKKIFKTDLNVDSSSFPNKNQYGLWNTPYVYFQGNDNKISCINPIETVRADFDNSALSMGINGLVQNGRTVYFATDKGLKSIALDRINSAAIASFGNILRQHNSTKIKALYNISDDYDLILVEEDNKDKMYLTYPDLPLENYRTDHVVSCDFGKVIDNLSVTYEEHTKPRKLNEILSVDLDPDENTIVYKPLLEDTDINLPFYQVLLDGYITNSGKQKVKVISPALSNVLTAELDLNFNELSDGIVPIHCYPTTQKVSALTANGSQDTIDFDNNFKLSISEGERKGYNLSSSISFYDSITALSNDKHVNTTRSIDFPEWLTDSTLNKYHLSVYLHQSGNIQFSVLSANRALSSELSSKLSVDYTIKTTNGSSITTRTIRCKPGFVEAYIDEYDKTAIINVGISSDSQPFTESDLSDGVALSVFQGIDISLSNAITAYQSIDYKINYTDNSASAISVDENNISYDFVYKFTGLSSLSSDFTTTFLQGSTSIASADTMAFRELELNTAGTDMPDGGTKKLLYYETGKLSSDLSDTITRDPQSLFAVINLNGRTFQTVEKGERYTFLTKQNNELSTKAYILTDLEEIEEVKETAESSNRGDWKGMLFPTIKEISKPLISDKLSSVYDFKLPNTDIELFITKDGTIYNTVSLIDPSLQSTGSIVNAKDLNGDEIGQIKDLFATNITENPSDGYFLAYLSGDSIKGVTNANYDVSELKDTDGVKISNISDAKLVFNTEGNLKLNGKDYDVVVIKSNKLYINGLPIENASIDKLEVLNNIICGRNYITGTWHNILIDPNKSSLYRDQTNSNLDLGTPTGSVIRIKNISGYHALLTDRGFYPSFYTGLNGFITAPQCADNNKVLDARKSGVFNCFSYQNKCEVVENGMVIAYPSVCPIKFFGKDYYYGGESDGNDYELLLLSKIEVKEPELFVPRGYEGRLKEMLQSDNVNAFIIDETGLRFIFNVSKKDSQGFNINSIGSSNSTYDNLDTNNRFISVTRLSDEKVMITSNTMSYIFNLTTGRVEQIETSALASLTNSLLTNDIADSVEVNGKIYIAYGNYVITFDAKEFSTVKSFVEPYGDYDSFAYNLTYKTYCIKQLENKTDFLIGDEMGLAYIIQKRIFRRFIDHSDFTKTLYDVPVRVINFAKDTSGKFTYLAAKENYLFSSENPSDCFTLQLKKLIQAPNYITGIYTEGRNNYIIMTTDGIYNTKQKYMLENEFGDYALEKIRNMIRERLAKKLEEHEMSHHSAISLIPQLNSRYADTNLDGYSVNVKKPLHNTSKSAYQVVNDIIKTIEYETDTNCIRVGVNNFAIQNSNGKATYSDSKYLDTYTDPFTQEETTLKNVPYIVKTFESGLKEINAFVPTTMTYYYNNVDGFSNSNYAAASIPRANIRNLVTPNSLTSKATRMRLYIYNGHFNIKNIVSVQITGSSLPLKIYKDNTYCQPGRAGMFDTVIQPSVLVGIPQSVDEKPENVNIITDDQNRICLDFVIYGTDAQSIKIIAE